jgi:uncharacterized protein
MNARQLKPLGMAAAGFLLLMAACRSVPSRVFTLEPVLPTSIAKPYSGPPIRVDAVHIPPALDRLEILTELAPGEFQVSDLDHWIAPLGQVARQALTADLIPRLPQGRVIFPHLAKPAGAIGINVDLLAFSSNREGATLEVSWGGTSDGSPTPFCGGTMLLQTTLSGKGSAAIARALSTLLAELADRIAEELLLLGPADPLCAP